MAEAHEAVAFRFEVGSDGFMYHIDNDAVAAILNSILQRWARLARAWAMGFFNGVRSSLPTTKLTLVVVPAAITTFHFGQFKWALLARTAFHTKFGFLPLNYRYSLSSALIYFTCAYSCKKLLKLGLSYNGFMYDPPRKISTNTRMWVIGMKWLAIIKPRLMIYQHVLPRLPLPSLHDTIERYLTSVKPLLTLEEFEATKAAAEDFQHTLGWKLQWYLRFKRFFASNYVTDWWENYVYLHGRSPLMINSNYYGLDCVYSTTKVTWASRAANLTCGLLKFRRLIDDGSLKPLMAFGVRPICSAQYERAFNTTRIPGKDCDILKHYRRSEHVAVYHKGRWFQVPVYHKGYSTLPAKDLEKLYQKILDNPTEPSPGEEKMASLTAWKRDEWARCRETHFLSNPTNRRSLNIIETAAFVVVLDEEEAYWSDIDARAGDKYAEAALHGKGYNKWFDKSLTLTVFSNGRCCVNAEHSWADAPVCCQAFEYAYYQDFKQLGYDEQGHTTGTASGIKLSPIKLTWDFSKDALADIELALVDAQQLITDTDIKLMKFEEFGKGFVKQCKCSPDGFIQLALQLAYYRDIGKFHLTYEASMTRLYLEGRTETVRACTEHTCNFVLALESGQYPKEELRKMITRSCEYHTLLYRDAMAGKGIDRHLFTLYVVSKYLKKDHDFLQKVIYEPWRLSTSQTPQIQMNLVDLDREPEFRSPGGGFGPVSYDGYGVSYVIAGENIFWFHVSSRKSSSNTDSDRFRNRIRQALLDIKAVYC